MMTAENVRDFSGGHPPWPSDNGFVGLCATCNNAKDCVYRSLRGTDAVYCETFDGFAPSPVRDTAPLAPAKARTAKYEDFKGLCMNCQSRNECALAKSDTGVWHCEEYK